MAVRKGCYCGIGPIRFYACLRGFSPLPVGTISNMNFLPVATKADLLSLDPFEIVQGYIETQRGDPEPGVNRGRSYWHGWRTAMMDMGEIEIDDIHRGLVHEIAPLGVLDPDVFRRTLR